MQKRKKSKVACTSTRYMKLCWAGPIYIDLKTSSKSKVRCFFVCRLSQTLPKGTISSYLPSLKLTAKEPEDGFLEDDPASFWFNWGSPIFRGFYWLLPGSGREAQSDLPHWLCRHLGDKKWRAVFFWGGEIFGDLNWNMRKDMIQFSRKPWIGEI